MAGEGASATRPRFGQFAERSVPRESPKRSTLGCVSAHHGPGRRPIEVSERNFFAELKRRNVYKVAVAYAVVGWLVIQVTATIVPALHLPDGLTTAVVVLVLVGFPVALVIAWAFEMTPEGMKRTENVSPDEIIPQWSKKKFAALIIGIAVIAAGLLTFQLLRSPRSTVTSTADAKSIAVLPFVNMSADKNDEYLSDGMTEELINVLSKMPGLRVPGRTSCFAFKGKNEEDIFRKVGDQLHVGTVLEGSVRKAGDKLRVTAQLINVSDGYHLWSKDYDGDVKDILNFQSNVAEQVVQALQVQLGTEAARALSKKPTELPEAHLSLACALGGDFDWRNAQIEFDRAIELNPNLAWAYEIYAWFVGGLGRLDEAIAKDKKAIELDPLNSFFQSALAYYLYHARRYDDAIVQVRKTLELDPTSTLAHNLLGRCLLGKGDTAGAIAEFQQSKINITGAWYQGLLGYAYAISGDRPKAEQMLGELEAQAKRQYVNSSAFAAIYLGLGEKEKALDWLDVAYENRESACWLLKVDPIYDSVRNEPRFEALLKKVGLDQ